MRRARGAGAAYGHVAYPWRAAFARSSPLPLRFYARLVTHQLRAGLPASRRFGPLVAGIARRGIPAQVVAGLLGDVVANDRERPDLNAIASTVRTEWGSLGLPGSAPDALHVLALQRRAAVTVFLFGAAPHPLVVVKLAGGDGGRAAREADLLSAAEPAGLAPRPLGRVCGGWAQEGLAGEPLDVVPLSPARAASLAWPAALTEVESALCRLAAATAVRGPADDVAGPVESALSDGVLDGRTRALLAAAWRDVRRLDVAVLRHHDSGPQNCLFDGGDLRGLVDWEYGVRRGAPSHDVLTAAVSYLDLGVGLRRWSPDLLVETFASAWSGPFGAAARAAASRAIAAAGVSDAMREPLEATFFGMRVGHRLDAPGAYPTDARTAARVLEVAVGA